MKVKKYFMALMLVPLLATSCSGTQLNLDGRIHKLKDDMALSTSGGYYYNYEGNTKEYTYDEEELKLLETRSSETIGEVSYRALDDNYLLVRLFIHEKNVITDFRYSTEETEEYKEQKDHIEYLSSVQVNSNFQYKDEDYSYDDYDTDRIDVDYTDFITVDEKDYAKVTNLVVENDKLAYTFDNAKGIAKVHLETTRFHKPKETLYYSNDGNFFKVVNEELVSFDITDTENFESVLPTYEMTYIMPSIVAISIGGH